jgi:hypothetical protein
LTQAEARQRCEEQRQEKLHGWEYKEALQSTRMKMATAKHKNSNVNTSFVFETNANNEDGEKDTSGPKNFLGRKMLSRTSTLTIYYAFFVIIYIKSRFHLN